MPFVDTNELEVRARLPGWNGRYFHSENMTFAYYEIDAGAALHTHSHPNEEVWNVVEGQLEVTIDAVVQVAGPGCAAVVPPDVAHSARALTDCRAIVVDHPVRNGVGYVITEE
jgi:quercetin dioxygenase-like cupin family protein